MVQFRGRGWGGWQVMLGLLGLVVLAGAPRPARLHAQQEPEPRLTADQLRQGGYVIFFRHGTTGDDIDAPSVTLADCRTQRNLSDRGLRDARLIGDAFRQLQIPVGQVLASEYCRAQETALVAFRRAEPAMGLDFCCADGRPLSAEQRAAFLARALATVPNVGTNTVLVGHGVGIVADLAMGEAAVYQPDGNGGFRRAARVLPAEWLAGVYRPGETP